MSLDNQLLETEPTILQNPYLGSIGRGSKERVYTPIIPARIEEKVLADVEADARIAIGEADVYLDTFGNMIPEASRIDRDVELAVLAGLHAAINTKGLGL